MFRQYLIDEIERYQDKESVKHLNNGAKRWKG